MARLKETILNKTPEGKGHLRGEQTPGVDLQVGGQQGLSPNMPGLVANSGYVKRNLVAVLLEAPRGFNDLPDPDVWIGTLKNLVELHATSIEGLNKTLTVEFTESAFGKAGEMQEDLSNVTRSRSTPTFVWPEKAGKVIQKFVEGWIINLLMDPNTKIPRVMSIGTARPTDLLADYTGMTVLFYEPDPTHTKVVEAWLCTNMMPKTGGENTGKMDVSAGGEKIDHSIEFTAITQTGSKVKEAAQNHIDKLGLRGFNSDVLPAFVTQAHADVDKDNNGGLANHVQSALDAAAS